MDARADAIIIGAGIGGLATALRLAARGLRVTVLERHAHRGGKMRTVPSPAGPVDAGPTVLTMRAVFDDLFAAAGARTEDHVTLHREPLLARHYWPDGSRLDLWDDPERSAQAVAAFAGSRAERDFRRFSARARRLFDGLYGPMMQAAAPRPAALFGHVARRPGLALDMGVGTLAQLLRGAFAEPRLRQLFGRYATYVGGSPFQSPGVLALIWHAEARGVWRVEGGMHRLADAVATLAEARGAEIRCGTGVDRIELSQGRPVAVVTEAGDRIAAPQIVYAGDPRAFVTGRLGADVQGAVAPAGVGPRSFSALVQAFAARVTGPDLAYHTVCFGAEPEAEFRPLEAGRLPDDPTVYICAEDRGAPVAPGAVERFETIINAPALGASPPKQEEINACLTRATETLSRCGLRFAPVAGPQVTTPEGFEALFPGSAGSLYGRSPHGLWAAFQRPTAATRIPGLWLAGGGAHPGAGVPMAALSGKHAAAAILSAQTSTSMSPRTAMPGGMSTGSQTTARAPSPSLASSVRSSPPGTAGPGARTPPTTAA